MNEDVLPTENGWFSIASLVSGNLETSPRVEFFHWAMGSKDGHDAPWQVGVGGVVVEGFVQQYWEHETHICFDDYILYIYNM